MKGPPTAPGWERTGLARKGRIGKMDHVMLDRWDWRKAGMSLFDRIVWAAWVVLSVFATYIALADHWIPIASGA